MLSEALEILATDMREKQENGEFDMMYMLSLPNRIESLSMEAKSIEQSMCGDSNLDPKVIDFARKLADKKVKFGVNPANTDYPNGGDIA